MKTRHRDLLAFDEVTGRLRLTSRTYVGIQTVPLERVIGSVDRVCGSTGTFDPADATPRRGWRNCGQPSPTASSRPSPPSRSEVSTSSPTDTTVWLWLTSAVKTSSTPRSSAW